VIPNGSSTIIIAKYANKEIPHIIVRNIHCSITNKSASLNFIDSKNPLNIKMQNPKE
jgi:hypothetical protein